MLFFKNFVFQKVTLINSKSCFSIPSPLFFVDGRCEGFFIVESHTLGLIKGFGSWIFKDVHEETLVQSVFIRNQLKLLVRLTVHPANVDSFHAGNIRFCVPLICPIPPSCPLLLLITKPSSLFYVKIS